MVRELTDWCNWRASSPPADTDAGPSLSPVMKRIRADDLVVKRGWAEDRVEAQRLLLSGRVRLKTGEPLKPGFSLPEDCELELRPVHRYVSRGGYKLEAALRHFGVEVRGKICVDLGASTGGFTDCLLQHGARRVYAFDVGKGVLDWSLRRNPNVEVREGINVRYLTADAVPERVDLVAADLSFISLRLILPVLLDFPGADLLLLVKPQFEAPREDVPRGGVIRDDRIRGEALQQVVTQAEQAGLRVLGSMECPVRGARGNREFFIRLRFSGS